ncbi:MAG: hypothetical protein AAF684_09045, partial [Pseudomonadota bacterium]
MKINGNAIRPGNVIEHQNRLWRAVKTQHVKPGKGGAFLQVELKEVLHPNCRGDPQKPQNHASQTPSGEPFVGQKDRRQAYP